MTTLPNTPYYGGGQVPAPINIIKQDGPPPSVVNHDYVVGQTFYLDKTDKSFYALGGKTGNDPDWIPFAGINSYPITQFVVGAAGVAGYQTIQSAIDAANAEHGGTVYIQFGTYTEDLTLYDGVSLVGVNPPDAALGAALTASCVTIVGGHTLPASGSISFSNITFKGKSNGSLTYTFISVVECTTSISIYDCVIDNHEVVSPEGAWAFVIPYFGGKLVATRVSYPFSVSGNDGFLYVDQGELTTIHPVVVLEDCSFGSTDYSFTYKVDGYLFIYNCYMYMPVKLGGACRVVVDNGYFKYLEASDAGNTVSGRLFYCTFDASESNCLNLNNAGTLLFDHCNFNSDATYAINGTTSGLRLSNATFWGSSSAISPFISYIGMPSLQGDTSLIQGNLSFLTDGSTLKLYNGGTSNSAIGVSGAVTLGTVTVPCTIVTANSYIGLQNLTVGTSTLPTAAYATNKIPGVSFDIVTSDPTDNFSTYQYVVINTIEP